MEQINGFLCKICTNEEVFSFELFDDGYSVHNYVDDKLRICVQTSRNDRNVAEWLASEYKKADGDFVPSRNLPGSFVIIDSSKKVFFIGRDYTQASHIYIFQKDDTYYISTDLHYYVNICKTLDAQAIDFMIARFIVGPCFPVFKDVEPLMPGRYMCINSIGEKYEKEFWRIRKVEVPDDYNEAVSRYGELLMDSIYRNISEDRAAVFLSGGSDSAAVVGALYKLGVKDVCAVHMENGINGCEGDDVKLLQKAYNFKLDFVKPFNQDKEKWEQYVDKSILNGFINSVYLSYPTYQLMGNHFRNLNLDGTTVFNGECCVLDLGFSESSDKSRGLRRWLYLQGGKKLSNSVKLAPGFLKVNWDKHRRPFLKKDSIGDYFYLSNVVLRTLLYSIGRPSEYYSGLKLGFRGLPGAYLGNSLLPHDYKTNINERVESFFDYFAKGLSSNEWKENLITMSLSWYSEASNFTMPNNVASIGNLKMCFPFSSTELMDFAASVPTEWSIDKKIQKDACKYVYDMPDQVAYRLKNHKESVSYFDIVYGELKEKMVDTILNTDFGPLNEGIKKLLSYKRDDQQVFNLYGYALWIRHYGLTVE